MTKEITTAGPALFFACTPVSVKMPVPITTPMPKPTRCRAERFRRSLPTPAASLSDSPMDSTGFVRNRWRATALGCTPATAGSTPDVARPGVARWKGVRRRLDGDADPRGAARAGAGARRRGVRVERRPVRPAAPPAAPGPAGRDRHDDRRARGLRATPVGGGGRAAGARRRPGGQLRRALNAVAADGSTYADRLDREV